RPRVRRAADAPGRPARAAPCGRGCVPRVGGRRARADRRRGARGHPFRALGGPERGVRAVAAASQGARRARAARRHAGAGARGGARVTAVGPVDARTRVATDPFVFFGCVELRQALDKTALDERELMDRIEELPPGSIFYHTHGYFLRHRPVTMAYGNDFARWVALEVRDQALAERLGLVDPFEFASLEDLREELMTIIHDHLATLSSVPRVEFGEPFFFQESHIIEVPLGATARTLAEFRAGLAGAEASAIYYHMVEARARLGRRSGDFAEWIRISLEMPELADRIGRIDTYMTSLERVRAKILSLVD